jgi:L-alanine-DL-glutamate epimerase-like enolase superfamily enzyme
MIADRAGLTAAAVYHHFGKKPELIMTKRDCVMVKVTTEDGIVGWGKSHHTRSPISSNLKMACSGRTSSPLALGMTPFTSLRMT